jgi:DNA processing protein
MDRDHAYLALHLLPGVGPVKARLLLERFGSPEAALAARRDQVAAILGPAVANALRDWESLVDLEHELELLSRGELHLVTWDHPLYPPLLREIHAPPLVLYTWGSLLEQDRLALAVVGTRRMSHYGRECAKRLSFQLARAGITVVSGLAYGIDTVAHEAALAAGGRTLAVLGSGLGHIYPTENLGLARRIAENGAVISQFPIETKPDPRLFPARNHIVSGICQGVLVVEGNRKSGSMLTAQAALSQNRSVYAVPGPIDRPGSAGPHSLIQDGAKLVCSASDILPDFPAAGQARDQDLPLFAPAPTLNETEQRLMDSLAQGSRSIEELVQKTGLPSPEVSSTLLRLEMRRLVRRLPGMAFESVG